MTKAETKNKIEKIEIEDSLKQEFKFTLQQRIERYVEIKPHGIIPNTHFAAVSTECYLLYRDGHYYGTISLVQAFSESLVKFLCEKNGWKPCNNYEKNVDNLKKRRKITLELKTSLTEIWRKRNDYHHLNSHIEQDRQKLESLTKNKLIHLKKVESELFSYTTKEGRLMQKYPKYWTQKKHNVFLRLA